MINAVTVWVVVGIAVISVAAVLVGRRVSRSGFLRGRTRIAVDKIGEELPGQSKTAFEVIQAVGVAYRIDPGILRPDDDLLTDLAKLDTWDLGSGQERLEKWLRARGIVSPLTDVRTLRDLVVHVSRLGVS
jgi:hypothetical protein